MRPTLPINIFHSLKLITKRIDVCECLFSGVGKKAYLSYLSSALDHEQLYWPAGLSLALVPLPQFLAVLTCFIACRRSTAP